MGSGGGTTTQATETALGVVRGATVAQSEAASGTTILGWTATRLRHLVSRALPTATQVQAVASSGSTRLVWTATRIHQLIAAVLPTVTQFGGRGRDRATARRIWTAGAGGTGDSGAWWGRPFRYRIRGCHGDAFCGNRRRGRPLGPRARHPVQLDVRVGQQRSVRRSSSGRNRAPAGAYPVPHDFQRLFQFCRRNRWASLCNQPIPQADHQG